MDDLIMFLAVVAAAALAVGWHAVVYQIEVRRVRKLNQQIRDCVVPVDYNSIAEVARQQNESVLHPTQGPQDVSFGDLLALRTRVAYIRVEGYDTAKDEKAKGTLFIDAIEQNPYTKGSGEAKQWARGFCQAHGTQPKGWMELA